MKHWYKLLLLLLMVTHTVCAGLYPFDSDEYCSAKPYLSQSISSGHLSLDGLFSQDDLRVGADNLVAPENDEGSSLTTHKSQYFLSIQRRITSIDRCATQGVVPTYHLLVAFNAPPLLELAMLPERPETGNKHWINKITANSSRISGWKESNLLYSHMHGKPLQLS